MSGGLIMDDVTVGGNMPELADDIATATTVGPSYSLHLNISKCEVISNTESGHCQARAYKSTNHGENRLFVCAVHRGSFAGLYKLDAVARLHTILWFITLRTVPFYYTEQRDTPA